MRPCRLCARARVYSVARVLSIMEETARPLSLLIKPNRNRKAESKLHNYTGLRLQRRSSLLLPV
jgi:hypothetical protein